MEKFSSDVLVVGGGIAGLTAASLLVKNNVPTVLIESHQKVGGCAGTFNRGKYIFDVGATQVAGFEKRGIHSRIFKYLEYELPEASVLDPVCKVDLKDGGNPINIWRDRQYWKFEREKEFPGSENFWNLCELLHQSNWSIAEKDPIIPFRTKWDFFQFISSIGLKNIPASVFTFLTIADLMWLTGCHKNFRLRKFLDMQLKLYSQKGVDETAALYGSTVLQMGQEPLGLWHINGSMQKLSNSLLDSLTLNGGMVKLGHKVIKIDRKSVDDYFEIEVLNRENIKELFFVKDIIFTPPPQSIFGLMTPELITKNYYNKLKKLPESSGAIVLYSAVERKALSKNSPLHLQISSQNFKSIFISISAEGDGRAPLGQATLIASVFCDVEEWHNLDKIEYLRKKNILKDLLISEINNNFKFKLDDWHHVEISTPKSFMRWTGRPKGIVGGLGQSPNIFGPFGLPSRTPIKNFWLCGDSIYPGEGTAGVSQSALMVCNQLLAFRGLPKLNIPF